MRIACILAEGFEDSELTVPRDRLTAAGCDVTIIGAEAGERLEGKNGKVAVEAEASIEDVDVDEFDALFIPGGYSPDHLRADPRFVRFVRDFDRAGKLIAAVCHGPQLLLTADLVRGRRMTAWTTVQVDLRRAGAHVVDREVVVDRNWVTSRMPEDLEAFSAECLEQLGLGADRQAVHPDVQPTG
jgi:protease I